MLFPSCNMILLFPLLSSLHDPNKFVLDPSCSWIRCTSNGPCNSDLIETFKTNAFIASFNAFVLDRVIGHLEHVMGPCWCFWAGPHLKASKKLDDLYFKALHICFLFFLGRPSLKSNKVLMNESRERKNH